MAANRTGKADVGARIEAVAAGIGKTWIEAEECSEGRDLLLLYDTLASVAGLDFVGFAREWYTAGMTCVSLEMWTFSLL